ncbi:MAG TPA: hypothetical protein DDE71_08750 [Tenacibaculum sp.]|nr:hypothetical protein [Tenacibaculum sp.]
MKLTNQQIDRLYEFTRKHYVEHYDLQTELVDHLTNDVETIWKESPSTSFQNALETSFKKFRIFGFMNIVEQKRCQLIKRYFKILLSSIKQWFQLPKILFTITGTIILYKIQELKNSYDLYLALSFILILIQSIIKIVNNVKLKRKHKITGKKWMLEEIIQVEGILNFNFLFFNLVNLFSMGNKDFIDTSEPVRWLYAAFMVSAIVLTYVALYLIPKKSEELLKRHYPAYELELT